MNRLFVDGMKNVLKFWGQSENVKNVVFLEFVIGGDSG